MNATDQNVTPNGEEEVAGVPMWLKVLVTVLSIAIIGMLLLIIFKIAAGDHLKDNTVTNETVSAPAAMTLPPVSNQDYKVARPAGMQLVSITPLGSDVFLHFRGEDGSEKIVVLNRQTGATSFITIE